jgi:hypothetical protein
MQYLKLLSSDAAKQVFDDDSADQRMIGIPVPSGDKDMLIMRRDDQAKELMRLLQILQQDVITDPVTHKEVSKEQMMSRARAITRRLMRSCLTVYLDDIATKGAIE